jgi:Competence protein CoiA-like family
LKHARRAAKSGDGTVLLAWAKDRDGRHVHVRALDRASRKERSPFSCIGCGEELVAKLGPMRARHFAHRPGSACPLTRPETALHLDAKERLLFLCAEAFAGRLAVRLGARCPRCRREMPLELGAAGDAASAEGAAGTLRADVLVTRRGAPALAFEVLVTHAVDLDKEAALAALGLPALEIDARESWEEEVGGGVAVKVTRTLGTAPCPACQATARADEGRARGGEEAEVAELEAYRARGLMGARPGPALPGPTPPVTAAEARRLERAFTCPECGRRELAVGARLVRHACPGRSARPVAWRGYDGSLVELAWWKPRPRQKR